MRIQNLKSKVSSSALDSVEQKRRNPKRLSSLNILDLNKLKKKKSIKETAKSPIKELRVEDLNEMKTQSIEAIFIEAIKMTFDPLFSMKQS